MSRNLQWFAVPPGRPAADNACMADLTAVQRICGLLDRGEIDRVQFLEQFTGQMAGEIGCERAAVRMLEKSTRSVDQIAQLVGYSDSRLFRAMFRQHAGMTASEWRANPRQK